MFPSMAFKKTEQNPLTGITSGFRTVLVPQNGFI